MKGVSDMNVITEATLQKLCFDLEPTIENIRRINREEQFESVQPITDARSAVLTDLLKSVYVELDLPLGGLQPVAGPTREGTIKTAIIRLVDAHSDRYFDPLPIIHKLVEHLEVGEM